MQVGHRVLDFGCGPASDTIALADLVGETGEVHGVGFDPEMVEEANVRAKAAGLGERVLHRHADAAALPFDDFFTHVGASGSSSTTLIRRRGSRR